MVGRKRTRSGSQILAVLTAAVVALGAVLWVGAGASDYREIKAELDHGTPRWYQTYLSSGYPVGCGATAWAIVFGYWKEHKGKIKLLRGVDMPYEQQGQSDTVIGTEMARIAQIMDTTYGSWQGKKYGRTTGGKMMDADIYVKSAGYTNVTIDRIRGTEYDKFRRVKEWLDLDRPVIILTNESDAAFTSLHYPVIEKATLRQKKVLGHWQDRDVYYSVNMGDGRANTEIWVREYGGNDHPHTGSFSMFLLNIR
jgi:hypothetical protein